jgi:hypothetical protein
MGGDTQALRCERDASRRCDAEVKVSTCEQAKLPIAHVAEDSAARHLRKHTNALKLLSVQPQHQCLRFRDTTKVQRPANNPVARGSEQQHTFVGTQGYTEQLRPSGRTEQTTCN